MLTIRLVRQALSLLSTRDRRRLILITVAQLATGFLDLAGVLLIGIVSVVSAAAVSGAPLPGVVQSAMRFLGLQDRDLVVLSAWLIAIAAIALITKSALSAVLARATFRFLANRQAQLSARLTAELLSRPLLAIQARASQDIAFGLTVGTQAATVGILGSASSALRFLRPSGAGVPTLTQPSSDSSPVSPTSCRTGSASGEFMSGR